MAVARKKPGSKGTKKATTKKPAAGKAKKPTLKKKTAAAPAKPTKPTKPTKPKLEPKKKAAAKTKKKAAAQAKTPAKAKKAPAKTKKSTAAKARTLPAERAIAVAVQLPTERPLTDEEREAMTKVALTALGLVDETAEPGTDAVTVVRKIGAYIDAVRAGHIPEPKTQDERLGIGVLWGEQVRAQVGWRWVHLSYPDGFQSYALVPDDRAFACFPLNRLAELVRTSSSGTNTSVPLFDSIRASALPQRRENAYLVIG